jgi:hypothetical protein
MSFKLEIKNGKSILNNIVCYEKVDKMLLLKLYCSSLLKTTFNNPFCSKQHKGELEQLGKYYNKINNNGYAEIKYCKTNDMEDWGRVFPMNSIGLYSIRRQLRHTLAKNYYVDIDVKNCHPEVLLQLCNKKGVEPKYLKYYANKRDKIFDLLYKLYLNHIESKSEKRDKAKQLFIRLLYFGTFENWLKDEDLELININEYDEDDINYNDIIKLHSFIDGFTKELNKIGKEIIKANPDLEKLVENKKAKRDEELSYNKKGSIVSYYLQEYENQILECIYKYLVSKKIINQNMPDVVLCADGLMIPKDKYNKELLNELQNEIYNELNFTLSLLDKDMDEDYLDIIDKSIIDNRFYKFYDSVKLKFEEDHFKIMNPILFAEETKNGLILRKKGDFSTAYENINYIDIKFNDKGEFEEKQKKFINYWFLDEDIRTYKRIDFLPKMTNKEEEKVYNTFNGFNVEKKIIDLSDCDIKFEDTKIYEHIKNLCGNDIKTTNYLIKTLAMKVQKPYKIMGTSIIFKSVEGCGKDSFFNFFGNKILGNRYYLNEDKIDLIFGRFNKLIENKLLVCINETSGSDTFTRMNCIKNAITREINVIEMKGIEGYENKNCILYIFFTNNEVVMKIDGNERRFICIECDSSIATDKDYFDALYKEFENDIYAKLFYDYLMNVDLSSFDFIKDRPETNFYKTLKQHSMPIFLKFIEEQYIKYGNKLKIKLYDDLYNKFNYYLQNGNIKYETNKIKLGMEIKKYDFIERIKKEDKVVYNIDFIKYKNYMIKHKYELDFIDE